MVLNEHKLCGFCLSIAYIAWPGYEASAIPAQRVCQFSGNVADKKTDLDTSINASYSRVLASLLM